MARLQEALETARQEATARAMLRTASAARLQRGASCRRGCGVRARAMLATTVRDRPMARSILDGPRVERLGRWPRPTTSRVRPELHDRRRQEPDPEQLQARLDPTARRPHGPPRCPRAAHRDRSRRSSGGSGSEGSTAIWPPPPRIWPTGAHLSRAWTPARRGSDGESLPLVLDEWLPALRPTHVGYPRPRRPPVRRNQLISLTDDAESSRGPPPPATVAIAPRPLSPRPVPQLTNALGTSERDRAVVLPNGSFEARSSCVRLRC